MRPFAVCCFVLLLFTASTTIAAAEAATTLDAEITSEIDDLFKPWSSLDGPGASVVIVRGKEVVLARGYGSADPERGIPIGPDTLFDAASVAKTFTGLGVSLLVADGTVSLPELDADLRQSMSEIRELPSALTVRHLLHHTSGLRDWPGGIVLSGGKLDDRFDFERVLRFIRAQRELNYFPGQRYSYTNSGYVLLARWLELRTGESFPEWMQHAVFDPLGMQSTVIPGKPGEPLQNSAVGLRSDGVSWTRAPRNSAVWGSSSLWTTANDLGRFMVELAERDAFDPLVFIMLAQPGKQLGGGTLNYGSGVEVGTHNGRGYIGHGGSWSGFRSRWRWLPERQLGVAMLSNVANLDTAALTSRLVEIVLGESDASAPQPGVELTTEQQSRLIGRYRFREDLDLEVFLIHGALHSRGTGQDTFALTALSPSELVLERIGYRLKFDLPRKGTAKGLVSHENGKKYPAARVEIEDGPKPEVLDLDELSLVLGRYPIFPTKRVEFRIESGSLVSQATGEATFPVERLTRDRFWVREYGAEFRFWRNARGRATGLTYRGIDAERLPDLDLASLARYEGVYRSPELSTEYRIEVGEDGLVARHLRHGTIPLTMTESNRFSGDRWYFKELKFEGRGNAPPKRLWVTISRLKNVVFERVVETAQEE